MYINQKPKALSCVLSVLLLATSAIVVTPVQASEPFIGQIQFFPYNFAPRSWTFCDGQLLPISQNTALFSLLGTIYGGDGRTNFAVPDMRGRSPLHPGRGPGLTSRRGGQRGGVEQVTLTINQIPAHRHALLANDNSEVNTNTGNQSDPAGHALSRDRRDKTYSDVAPDVLMNSAVNGNTGGNQAHNNMPPFLVVNCNIAMQGTYPSRQ